VDAKGGNLVAEKGTMSEALMREIDREKQASRDADERDLASGRKSREQLSRENGLFHGRRWIVDLGSAKRLW
jgi:hypothetical protein